MKNLTLDQYKFVFLDFEFRPKDGIEGNPVEVTCMVAFDLHTGKYHKLWKDELYGMSSPPFAIDADTVLVAYFASAEMACFEALGWTMPENILDLFVEFRNLTNGIFLPEGKSLLGALKYFGLDAISAEHKDDMRDLALRGGPYSTLEKVELLKYCQSDVDSLYPLYLAMKKYLDFPRALLRGLYGTALARMETLGIPIDYSTYKGLCLHWDAIKAKLIAEVDSSYGVYEDGVFKEAAFQKYVHEQNIR